MDLWSAELTPQSGNSYLSGFIVRLSDGSYRQVAWQTGAPINPTLDAAKEYAAKLLQSLLNEGMCVEVRDTNWASVAAAIHRIVEDFNSKLRERLLASCDLSGVAARELH